MPSANAFNVDQSKTLSFGKELTLYLNMPVLGSSNSAANKDMMSKIRTYGDTII